MESSSLLLLELRARRRREGGLYAPFSPFFFSCAMFFLRFPFFPFLPHVSLFVFVLQKVVFGGDPSLRDFDSQPKRP